MDTAGAVGSLVTLYSLSLPHSMLPDGCGGLVIRYQVLKEREQNKMSKEEFGSQVFVDALIHNHGDPVCVIELIKEEIQTMRRVVDGEIFESLVSSLYHHPERFEDIYLWLYPLDPYLPGPRIQDYAVGSYWDLGSNQDQKIAEMNRYIKDRAEYWLPIYEGFLRRLYPLLRP